MYSLPQGAREALDALLEAQEDLTAPAAPFPALPAGAGPERGRERTC